MGFGLVVTAIIALLMAILMPTRLRNSVDFQMVTQFGDQSFEMSFKGKIQDAKLAGELTTSRGSQKVTGTKIVRTGGRRGN